jgi:hypothetical protein
LVIIDEAGMAKVTAAVIQTPSFVTRFESFLAR